MARIPAIALLALLFTGALFAQESKQPPALRGSDMLLVLPFDNKSSAQGLDWIGEAFADVLSLDMAGPHLFVISRDDRAFAFDQLGLPAAARLSRATTYRTAEQMDVDYLVVGSYNYDGNIFSAKAQVMDVRRVRLKSEVAESGSLLDLVNIQRSLAWDLLRELDAGAAGDRQQFVQSRPAVRLDALENYIRGVIATTPAEKLRRFKEAVRLAPDYTIAQLQLGKTLFQQKDYANSIVALEKVPPSTPQALEASFYLGLSAYYAGNYERAEAAFQTVAAKLPLTEVYNNLGVVAARRGKPAVEFFDKAAQTDPGDADYHFNLGLALLRSGDSAGATKQLREAMRLKPGDAEAKAALDRATGAAAQTSAAKPPLERVKRNYDEAAFRQLSMEMQNVEEARMANADPRVHAAYLVDRGREMLKSGLPSQALAELREAVQLDPNNPDAHAGLADAAALTGDTAQATREAQAGLRLKPTAQAYIALARVALKQENPQQALDYIGKARALDPANADVSRLEQQLAGTPAQKGPRNP